MSTSQLFPDYDCVWLVEEHIDLIKKRRKKLLDKDERWRARMFGSRFTPAQTFNSEFAAWQFAVERAKGRVKRAEAALKAERKRLQKCESRLATMGGASE